MCPTAFKTPEERKERDGLENKAKIS